jgi:hypothetical protein
MRREGSLVTIEWRLIEVDQYGCRSSLLSPGEQSCHNHRIEDRIAFKWHRQPMLPPQHVVSSHTLYHKSTATMLSIDSSKADVSWGLEFEQATRGAPDTDLY